MQVFRFTGGPIADMHWTRINNNAMVRAPFFLFYIFREFFNPFNCIVHLPIEFRRIRSGNVGTNTHTPIGWSCDLVALTIEFELIFEKNAQRFESIEIGFVCRRWQLPLVPLLLSKPIGHLYAYHKAIDFLHTIRFILSFFVVATVVVVVVAVVFFIIINRGSCSNIGWLVLFIVETIFFFIFIEAAFTTCECVEWLRLQFRANFGTFIAKKLTVTHHPNLTNQWNENSAKSSNTMKLNEKKLAKSIMAITCIATSI